MIGNRLLRALCLIMVGLFMGALGTGTVSAISETDLRSIIKYTPFYGEDADGGTKTASACGNGAGLSGNSNEEKVWSYFAGKDLTPIAIAGIMGNFKQENGSYDPAAKQNYSTAAIPPDGDGTTGYGIAQWTSKDRQKGLFNKIDQAGLSKYYGAGFGNPDLDKQTMPQADIDKLLQVELDYVWSGDTPVSNMAKELNAKTSVAGDGGSTIYFHQAFERSADNASQIQERVDSANDILGRLGSNSCGSLGGVSTIEDGVAWAKAFISDIQKFNARTTDIGEQKFSDGVSLYGIADGATCSFDTLMGCEQCTALSGWFVATMTEYTYRGGDGAEVVGNLAGQVPTGNTPKPFSVFSYNTGTFGHTGVVLGVLDGGQVITLENNWPSLKLSIRKYNIKQEYPGATFAYVGDKMKNSVANN